MNNLVDKIDNIKKKYRKIFLKTHEEFTLKVEGMTHDEVKKFLYEDIVKEIYHEYMKMLDFKKNFSCSNCATCCNLACSEFSPEELKQKAKNGDNFAQQFTSVFIPYENENDAQKIYPEYFELLKAKAINETDGEKVYFYHCPKVTNNKCPDYETRPQICRDFPDNPINLLPKTCGYQKWRDEAESKALTLHSLLEIVDFYRNKLQAN